MALKSGNHYTELAEPSICILTEKWQHPCFENNGRRTCCDFLLWTFWWHKKANSHWNPISYTDIICHHSHDLKSKTNPEKGFLFFFLRCDLSLPLCEFKILRKRVLIWGRVSKTELEMQHFLWHGLAKCWWYKLTAGGQETCERQIGCRKGKGSCTTHGQLQAASWHYLLGETFCFLQSSVWLCFHHCQCKSDAGFCVMSGLHCPAFTVWYWLDRSLARLELSKFMWWHGPSKPQLDYRQM